MPDDTYTFPPVDVPPIQPGVWTEVAVGPIELLITSTDNFHFRWSAEQPTDPHGHFRRANEDAVCPVYSGQSLWVMNPHQTFRLAVTQGTLI